MHSIRDDINFVFNEEWNKRKFKWFFPKRRKAKLKYRIIRQHSSQIFNITERAIESTLNKHLENVFDQFVDIRDIVGDDGIFEAKPDVIRGRRLSNAESSLLNYQDIYINEEALNEAIGPFVKNEKEKTNEV